LRSATPRKKKKGWKTKRTKKKSNPVWVVTNGNGTIYHIIFNVNGKKYVQK
jgi:hypothetical protein